ncbi:MAG: peptidoglycan-binding domain-containing protein [Hyphomicrobiaceae bacterium]
MLMNFMRPLMVGVIASTIMSVSQAALAQVPSAGDDIKGKTVYLTPRAALRYGKSLLSRVYTRTGAVLKLEGSGPCTTFNCPVVHNGVELYARRLRLDVSAPSGSEISSDRTLRPGDEGLDVRQLQEILTARGFDVEVDGKFGPKTEDAVKTLQRSSNITPDGAVGREVRQALALSAQSAARKQSPAARVKQEIAEKIDQVKSRLNPINSIGRILRLGDEGDDVRVLQQALVSLGYDIKIDGKYGQGTKSAIRDFQSRHGVPADGNFGPQTAEKMGS